MLLQVLYCFWLRYRARGVENIPSEGGALLLINHQSMLDPFLAGVPLHRAVSYLARDTLFPVPVIGWCLRNAYAMPISRGSGSTAVIRKCVDRLKLGFLVGMFPEGTRSRDGELGRFKPGFLAILRRANVPVIPVGIDGAQFSMTRGSWMIRPVKVRVVFGKAIRPSDVQHLIGKGHEKEMVEFIKERVAACQAEARIWRTNGVTAGIVEETRDTADS